MSSLAYWASPIDENNRMIIDNTFNKTKTQTPISKTRSNIKKTNTDRVTTAMRNIHDRLSDEDGDETENINEGFNTGIAGPVDDDETNMRSISANYPNSNYSGEYNQAIDSNLPPIRPPPMYKQSSIVSNIPNSPPPNDVMLKKINYLIHLMEENKDNRTNNVTEEVVLYSFLGVFVILVVDSFVKVGKYIR